MKNRECWHLWLFIIMYNSSGDSCCIECFQNHIFTDVFRVEIAYDCFSVFMQCVVSNSASQIYEVRKLNLWHLKVFGKFKHSAVFACWISTSNPPVTGQPASPFASLCPQGLKSTILILCRHFGQAHSKIIFLSENRPCHIVAHLPAALLLTLTLGIGGDSQLPSVPFLQMKFMLTFKFQ